MSIYIEQITVGGYDDNLSYVLYDALSKEALIVDPSGDIEKAFGYIEQQKLSVVGVVLTHTHVDHMGKLDVVLERYAVPVYVHELGRAAVTTNDVVLLQEGSVISLGDSKIEVLHTPGHIADAVCLYITKEQATEGSPILITGDTLFVEGCGRTTSSEVRSLYDSLQRLILLPDDTRVYPGHDYGSTSHSTIAHEKKHNRFILTSDFEAFKKLRLG